MAVTINSSGWIAEATGIYWPRLTFGPFQVPPRWIVLHATADPNATAEDIGRGWANESANGTGNASTHIIINKDGSFVQGLSLLMRAWGNSGALYSPRASYLPTDNLNNHTISIEHCKNDGDYNSDVITPAQAQTSFEIVREICNLYNIPRQVVTIGDPSNGGIIRHKDCDGANRPFCPGPYPFADLQNFLNGGPSMFTNNLAIAVWGSYFKEHGKPIPSMTSGICQEWLAQWKNGHFKFAPESGEYPIPGGVAQNFGGGVCQWVNDAPAWVY